MLTVYFVSDICAWPRLAARVKARVCLFLTEKKTVKLSTYICKFLKLIRDEITKLM